MGRAEMSDLSRVAPARRVHEPLELGVLLGVCALDARILLEHEASHWTSQRWEGQSRVSVMGASAL